MREGLLAARQAVSHTKGMLCAGEIIKPQGAFQMGLFWLMPVIQPLLCMLLAALAAFSVAYAGVAALHFQPYVAPLLVRVLEDPLSDHPQQRLLIHDWELEPGSLRY